MTSFLTSSTLQRGSQTAQNNKFRKTYWLQLTGPPGFRQRRGRLWKIDYTVLCHKQCGNKSPICFERTPPRTTGINRGFAWQSSSWPSWMNSCAAFQRPNGGRYIKRGTHQLGFPYLERRDTDTQPDEYARRREVPAFEIVCSVPGAVSEWTAGRILTAGAERLRTQLGEQCREPIAT